MQTADILKNGLKFGISGACHLEFYKGIRYNGLEINKTERRCGDAEKAGNAAACVHNIWYHIECCARGGAAEISAMIRGDCAFDHFVDLLRSR